MVLVWWPCSLAVLHFVRIFDILRGFSKHLGAVDLKLSDIPSFPCPHCDH